MIKILETPRDAMQGIPHFIATQDKVRYLNALLEVGFDMLDFGSFVSPRAIPQLRDSAEVIEQLNTHLYNTEIIATIGNLKGAQRAFEHDKIDAVAFPFSISETFLKKNINSDFIKGQQSIDDLLNLSSQKNKRLKLYIAMAFGNPYGDEWNCNILTEWVEKLTQMGVDDIVLADTTGDGTAQNIGASFARIIAEFPSLKPGAHLHTLPDNWRAKLAAAYENGCRSFDSVAGGYGGCPMSGKALMGNLNTTQLLEFLDEKKEKININKEAYFKALTVGGFVFGGH